MVVPLFTSGCFNMMANMGDGSGPSPKVRAEATALDVATLPVQIVVVPPVALFMAANSSNSEKDADRAERPLMLLLEKNPEIAFQERWDTNDWHHWHAFVSSFSNSKVKYSDDLLEQIHHTCPKVQEYVFRSQSCSKEFLTRHFDEEYMEGKYPVYSPALINIVENPNTPIELVEKVASNHDYRAPAYRALAVLAKRQPNQTDRSTKQ